MKVFPFTIPKPTNTAIIFQIDKGRFYNKLHQHEEVQISMICEGQGTLIAGESIHSFKPGDVLVLGGEQPHVFQCDDHSVEMHSVFFNLSAFGSTFLALAEGKDIVDFYAFAKAGFKTITTATIRVLFEQLKSSSGMQKLAHFITLLSSIQQCKGEVLSHFSHHKKLSEKEGRRMSAILEYSFVHYTEAISLNDIAQVAAMTPHAFCKYFKKRTDKTYVAFLMELRIEKAASLLKSKEDFLITDIAERSGFKTLSHFNRIFKRMRGVTPSQFRGR